ncbi:MAG: stage III sporulation protein AB [Oscillospiraceae bacterium]|nr:stage III sporulation protein AB [Oscillospiraceae bacterium]
MSIKLIGAVLVIAASGGFGITIAASHRREVKYLRQLLAILDYMECELQYRLTPLPQLCKQSALEASGLLKTALQAFSTELENQVSPDVSSCMTAAVSHSPELPTHTKSCLLCLGQSLGKFDLQGQLKGLEYARQFCREKLEMLENNKEVRLRSYQTLCLCAGAALAILLI